MLEKMPVKRTTICIPGNTSSSNGMQADSSAILSSNSGRQKLNYQLTQTASPPSHQPDQSEVSNLNHEAMLAYYNTTGHSSNGAASARGIP